MDGGLVEAVGIAVGLETGAGLGSCVSITAVAVGNGELVGNGVAAGVEADRAVGTGVSAGITVV